MSSLTDSGSETILAVVGDSLTGSQDQSNVKIDWNFMYWV